MGAAAFALPAALADDPLVARSVGVLRAGQASSGAFVASPSFDVYRYAWLRDGAFCAHALHLVGDHAAAARFHGWTAAAVGAQRPRVERTIGRIHRGDDVGPHEMLPARFTLDGAIEPPGEEPWPNFQLDGYGMWLWAVAEHLDGVMPAAVASSVELVARYLRAAWRIPCWGCWEEFDDGEHACTLAAVAAGLAAAGRLLARPDFEDEAERVREHLVARFVRGGRFARCATDDRVDGSLLWLATPFGPLPLDDARIQATIDAVRRELVGPGGGVYRYIGDTYYGGGQWLLLTCSLAWVDRLCGRDSDADASREWVRRQANADGDLPEQVTDHAQTPAMVAPWVARWGRVATPLLWSHAMYLIMELPPRPAWSSSR